MLYADDLVIVRRSIAELQWASLAWKRLFERYGLKINMEKTEYMTTGEQHSDLRVEQQQIKRVEKFKYLGTILSDDTSVAKRLYTDKKKAWTTWKEVTGILFDKKIPKRMKSEIYKRMIRPAMTYGSECLTVKKKENDKFEVTEMKMLRRIEGITRLDRRRNEDVRRALDVEPINEFIRTNRLRWFGHLYRRGENNILKKIYNFEQHGRRKRGRPKTTWKRVTEEDINSRGLQRRTALDRAEWRRHLEGHPN